MYKRLCDIPIIYSARNLIFRGGEWSVMLNLEEHCLTLTLIPLI